MSKSISFEIAISELEDKVRQLESGNMSLDESIQAFEKAVALAKVCNRKIEMAERKVRILVEGIDGSVTDEPFNANSDET